MKRTVGYVISEKNSFGGFAYKGVANYYMAKIVEEYDDWTGEILNAYYEQLSDKFAYRNEKIKKFRGLDVEEI